MIVLPNRTVTIRHHLQRHQRRSKSLGWGLRPGLKTSWMGWPVVALAIIMRRVAKGLHDYGGEAGVKNGLKSDYVIYL